MDYDETEVKDNVTTALVSIVGDHWAVLGLWQGSKMVLECIACAFGYGLL